MKKTKGKVADAKDNGGFHNLKGYRSAEAMLRGHDYIKPRLYHLCFVEADTKEPYLAAMKALMEYLRTHGVRGQYKAALEISAKGKLHFHAYVLLDADQFNTEKVINHNKEGWMYLMMLKKGLDYHINAPRSPLHRKKDGTQKNYATVPKSKPAFIDDCCTWIEYLYKHRDKQPSGTVYFSSRPSRELKESLVAD